MRHLPYTILWIRYWWQLWWPCVGIHKHTNQNQFQALSQSLSAIYSDVPWISCTWNLSWYSSFSDSSSIIGNIYPSFDRPLNRSHYWFNQGFPITVQGSWRYQVFYVQTGYSICLRISIANRDYPLIRIIRWSVEPALNLQDGAKKSPPQKGFWSGLCGAYGTRTRICPQSHSQIVASTKIFLVTIL